MDILRKNLDLVVNELERLLAKSDGKQDGAIIDALRLAQNCQEMSHSMKGARRWISVEERLPIENGTYEVTSNGDVKYGRFYGGFFSDDDVIYWRKKPKIPRG